MTKSSKVTFSPVKPEKGSKGIYFEVNGEFHARIKIAARYYNMSIRDFVTQALKFAMEHTEIDFASAGDEDD